jgi:SAM-dependent methyltransferase
MHGETIRSPLTGTENVTVVETVPAERLITSWQAEYQIDITNELEGISEIVKYRCNDTSLGFFAPQSAAGSEWLYEQMQRLPWYYQNDKWEFRVARHELRQCRAVLEIGCGTGEFLKLLKADGHETVGCELNRRALTQARAAGLEVSGEELSTFRGRGFDAACSFQVLEHVTDPADFIRSITESVRPGGKIAFAVPNSLGFVGLGYDILQYPPHHMSCWTADSFRALSLLFPLRLEKIIAEPLAVEHVDIYLQWNLRHWRERARLSRWIFNGKTLRLFRKLLQQRGLRRLFTGHSLYAQFVKV